MVSLIADPFFLIPLAFITSALTAAIGLGGGVMLLALMPFYMPFTVAIPLHGAVQLTSNLSRFILDWQRVRWDLIPSYTIGAIMGAVGGFFLLGKIPETYLPLGLGIFILLILWTPLLRRLGRWLHKLWLVAAIQSFFSLFVGSTGLISPPVLMDKGLEKDEVIVTHAVQMSVMHSVKVAVFVAAGVSMQSYSSLLISMMIAAIIGSACGTKLRRFVPEKQGARLLKAIITLLALKLILSAAY